MKQVLVINVNWVGDVIFSSPLFRAIKETYPEVKISCLAVPRVREVLNCIPHIDEIIIYDERGLHFTPWAKIKLIRQIKNRKFDCAVILHKSLTRALFAYLAGIPVRIGYDTKKRGSFLTHRIPEPQLKTHRSQYYLNLSTPLNILTDDYFTELRVPENNQEEIEKLLKENNINSREKYIIVHPAGNWNLKRWPEENFILLISRILQDSNIKVIITGAVKDEPLAQNIQKSLNNKAVLLAGKTTIKQLLGLMKRAELVISADSGPLHMANSMGTSVIGLYGPTDPAITGPVGRGKAHIVRKDVGCNRNACYHLKCPDNICMRAISVEDVIDAVNKR